MSETLSDKINNSPPEAPRIYVDDVKDFIGKLKEELVEAGLNGNFKPILYNIVDKLAGEKLI